MVTNYVNSTTYQFDYEARQVVKKEKEATPTEKSQNVKTIDFDYSTKRSIDRLSERLQNSSLYTKEASKAVAEMMLSKKVEFVA